MSIEANKQLVEQFFESSNAGDLESSIGLIADDIEWTEFGTTSLAGTHRGIQELQEKLLGPLFSQLKQGIHMEVRRLIAEGDTVVAETRGTAETLDGRVYNNTYCWVITIRDGKFSKVTEYSDTELVASVFD